MRKVKSIILLFVMPFLAGCSDAQNLVQNIATSTINVLTFIGIGVAVVTLMLAGMSIIVNRATGSSRGISENVKTYIVIGGLVIALLLLPRLVGMTISSLSNTLKPNVTETSSKVLDNFLSPPKRP